MAQLHCYVPDDIAQQAQRRAEQADLVKRDTVNLKRGYRWNDLQKKGLKMKSLIALATLLIASASAIASEVITGKVVSIADGDTLTILDVNHQQHRIRFAQIDAQETYHGKDKPAQPFGERSKQSASEMSFGKEARAECSQADRYGRSVCTIFIDGQDLNLEQVRRGMAMVYRQYAHSPEYFKAEEDAKRMHLGLWSDPNPTPPWNWRHR